MTIREREPTHDVAQRQDRLPSSQRASHTAAAHPPDRTARADARPPREVMETAHVTEGTFRFVEVRRP